LYFFASIDVNEFSLEKDGVDKNLLMATVHVSYIIYWLCFLGLQNLTLYFRITTSLLSHN